MRTLLLALAAGLVCTAPAAAQFDAPIFATPLPPGPGQVPIVPNGKLVAPVLMPFGTPTAAPVGIYQYGDAAPQPYAQPVGPTEYPAGAPAPSTAGRQFYAAADFLYAVTQGVFVPPLVALSPPGTPSPGAGALYSPTTLVQFGGRRLLNDFRPGFRLNLGMWFGCDGADGLDLGFVSLGGLSNQYIGSSGPGGVVLARPLVNGLTATNVGLPVAGPFPGGITASATTSFLGGDVNYRRRLRPDGCCQLDVLAGFRYLHLGDTVDVWQTSAPGANPVALAVPTTGALVHDWFSTRNNFYGPQVGFITQFGLGGGFSLELLTKVALGVTAAAANTDASTQTAGGLVFGSGVLVGPTNRVSDTTGYFAVVPEVGAKLGYSFTDTVRATVGYTFLYWSEVRRASEQVDLTVLAPGRPAFRDVGTDFWLQGWTIGVEVRY
jgi:hypothetical protein